MNIVFAGTPALTIPTLNALLDSPHRVTLVVTQPDRPAGRGRKLVAPPIKAAALERGIPVIQPTSINRPEAAEAIGDARPDALIVFAYGKRLLPRVLELPAMGCFNIHASLLPRYRGAAPINYALLNGDDETGVTIQRMAKQIDTGPILVQRTLAIGARETAGELSDRLALLAAEAIVPTLDGLDAGTLEGCPQNPALATEAPSLRKSDGNIPWTRSAAEIDRFTRAMTPWPGAFTFHHKAQGKTGSRVILLAARPVTEPGEEARHALGEVTKPGVIVRADHELIVATGEGFLSVDRLKPGGAKVMEAAAYLRGHSVAVGDRFRDCP